ncbi:hypothetical protein [Nocardia cyriacigeorgica]|uniref:hypothetical protein n=1 Tax=Nocardia cyriacigeorgica TaxID=135487 RepID=UPI002456E897|nr:hypothetical protein [Nocardia cyriacigeorgica]
MIVVITLLVCAVIALRGYLPGVTESEDDGPSAMSAIAVALMPVLLTVSVVILLAGVIASQHRLPLAMPEPDPDTDREPWKLGRAGLIVLGILTALALLFALVSAVYFVGGPPGAGTTGGPPPGPPPPPNKTPRGRAFYSPPF